jgi:hypothetical protein
MTLSTFTPANASGQAESGNRLSSAGYAASNAGRVFSNAAATVGEAIFVRIAYRAALKRLEAGAEGNLFDQPVLWAELKSGAWAEARETVGQRKHQLPL